MDRENRADSWSIRHDKPRHNPARIVPRGPGRAAARYDTDRIRLRRKRGKRRLHDTDRDHRQTLNPSHSNRLRIGLCWPKGPPWSWI
ncbi:MAG: hypothetical protein IH991_24455 [Planctomycetes bacterium]|nr:hypothetical protein [Planctomycetota bacterium]